MTALWVALVVGLAVALALIVLWSRFRRLRPSRVQEASPSPQLHVDHAALEAQGTELIRRRVELDARRGALGGDSDLLGALDALDERKRCGLVTEEEYEAEKIRLLGG